MIMLQKEKSEYYGGIMTPERMKELGWKPSVTFEEVLERTINWYLDNEAWLQNVTSGAYKDYYKKQYS